MENPFVGPHPLTKDNPIFGRDREIAELRHLVTAERLVLLHSPSGAGKSSLINAGLIPELNSRFDVWNSTRVHTEPPPGTTANRYVWSTLGGWGYAGPDVTLASFVTSQPRSRHPLLIFDQFEEIIRANPSDTAGQAEFFRQLAELLRFPYVWALIIIREDYLAPLLPWFTQLPTHLRARYRLDFLTTAQAGDAIASTALHGGRRFGPGALDALLRSLATVTVHNFDGSTSEASSSYVEPMHLQVVCHRLWERMDVSDTSIDLADIKDFGSVTESLALYYNQSVASFAKTHKVPERAIRDWFQKELITPSRTRGQVQKSAGKSGSLDTTVIEDFLATHLVRVEPRRTGWWYELAHDRLIEPVLSGNADWYLRNLNPIQQSAVLWAERREPDGLLLPADQIDSALEWLRLHQASATPNEQKFIQKSQARAASEEAARLAALREAAQNKRLKLWLRLVIAAVAVALLFAGAAVWQKKQADSRAEEAARSRDKAANAADRAQYQGELAEMQRVAATSLQALAESERARGDIQRLEALSQEKKAKSALAGLALQNAIAEATEGKDANSLAWVAVTLRLNPSHSVARFLAARLLQQSSWWIPARRLSRPQAHRLPLEMSREFTTWISSSGSHVVSEVTGAPALVWNLSSPSSPPLPIPSNSASLTWSGLHALAGTTVWNVAARKGTPLSFPAGTYPNDYRYFLSDDGAVVIAGGARQSLVWDAASGKLLARHAGFGGKALVPRRNERYISATEPIVRASPNGSRVASISQNATLLWDTLTGKQIATPLFHTPPAPIRSIAFSHDNRFLATTAGDSVKIWNIADGTLAREFRLPGALDVAFSPATPHVAVSSRGRSISVWNLAAPPSDSPTTLATDSGRPSAPAFSRDGKTLFAGLSAEGFAVWNLSTRALSTTRSPYDLPGGSGLYSFDVTATANGRLRGVRTDGQDVVVWEAASGWDFAREIVPDFEPGSIDVAHDRDQLVYASSSGRVQTVDLASGLPFGPPRQIGPPDYKAQLFARGQLLLSRSPGGAIRIFRVDTGRPLGPEVHLPEPILRGLQASPDFSRILVTANSDRSTAGFRLRLLDPVSGRWIGAPLDAESLAGFKTRRLTASGRAVLFFSDRGDRKLWVPESGQLRDPAPGESILLAPAPSVSVEPQRLLTAPPQVNFGLLHPDSGQQIGPPMTLAPQVFTWSAAISPNAQLIATGGDTKSMTIWEAGTARPLLENLPFPNSSGELAWSRDGRYLVTRAGRILVYRTALDDGSPAEAELLASLAEIAAGSHVSPDSKIVPLPGRIARVAALRRAVSALPASRHSLAAFIRYLLPED